MAGWLAGRDAFCVRVLCVDASTRLVRCAEFVYCLMVEASVGRNRRVHVRLSGRGHVRTKKNFIFYLVDG